MTLHQLGFKYLSAPQIEAAQTVATELMKRIEYVPGEEPSHEILLAALATVFANIGGKAVEDGALNWYDFVRPLISDIRAHIIPCAPAPPKSVLTQDGLTVNQVNFMRALVKYPNGAMLSTIETDTCLNRRSLQNGAAAAVREGFVERTTAKQGFVYYSLTEEGAAALARLDERTVRPLPIVSTLNPRVHTRVPRSHRPTGPRLKSSS